MAAHAIHSTASLQEANAPGFQTMQGTIDRSLLKGLKAMNCEYMTPVQSKVLTDLPSLRSDCLVQAKTGTGKTLAFLLPALQSLLASPVPLGQVAILIITPTRELAQQIAKECDRVTAHLPRPIECHTAFGGTARDTNHKKFLRGNPSVLVATPGRLLDYLTDDGSEGRTCARFSDLRTLILDEADTMLEAGFLQSILKVLKLLPPKNKGWQGMCFSATMPSKIREVISCILAPDHVSISTIDKSEPPTHTRVPQYSVIIPSVKDTLPALYSLIQTEHLKDGKEAKIIVFGITANGVGLYADVFQNQLPIKVYELQSRLSQANRTRTTETFKSTSRGIMFATDVVGRGMDFPDVTCVIQVGLPMNGDQYVHRVGRTARAGKDGRAVILLTQGESFFLKVNPQLKIQPHERQQDIVNDQQAKEKVSQILETIGEDVKTKAYSAYIGFMRSFSNKLGLNPPGLVKLANEFAVHGMGCPEPPALKKKTIGMMGLKGVPGLRIAKEEPPVPNETATGASGNATGASRTGNGLSANGGGRPKMVQEKTNNVGASLGKHRMMSGDARAVSTASEDTGAQGRKKAEGPVRKQRQNRRAAEERMRYDAAE